MDTPTPIGFRYGKSDQQPVCIPLDLRLRHTHVIGRTETGKSTLIEHMALHDIQGGHGVAVLDPHGSLVERLLSLIPRGHIDRVVYLKPGDPGWVPIWNPLLSKNTPGQGQVIDALARSFSAGSFGHRSEHVLRQTLPVVLQLPNGNLLDVLNLIRRGPSRNAGVLRRALKSLDDPITRRFWQQEFRKYTPHELKCSVRLLQRLFDSEPCSRMLSQRDTSFNLQDIMDSGKIMLVDLSSIDPEASGIIGGLMLALLHLAAVGRRSNKDSSLRPFDVYCDDAHRVVSDPLDDLIAESRRFEVSLTLAHQDMSQFIAHEAALSSAGSTIILNVASNDAQLLRKNLQGKVEVGDLVALDVGWAIARIGVEVVWFRTSPPLEIPSDNCRDLIVQQSHERYYRPMR